MTSPLISFFITAPCQKTASTDAGLGQMTKQAPRGALHPDFISLDQAAYTTGKALSVLNPERLGQVRMHAPH